MFGVSFVWMLIYSWLMDKPPNQKIKRICPYCNSKRMQVVRIMGQAPLNVWDDVVCVDCGERWETYSKIDKISRNLICLEKYPIRLK